MNSSRRARSSRLEVVITLQKRTMKGTKGERRIALCSCELSESYAGHMHYFRNHRNLPVQVGGFRKIVTSVERSAALPMGLQGFASCLDTFGNEDGGRVGLRRDRDRSIYQGEDGQPANFVCCEVHQVYFRDLRAG